MSPARVAALVVLAAHSLGPAAVTAASTVVVLNKAEATASLIEESTGKVVATLATGDGPHEVAVSPDGRLALCGDYGVRGAPGNTLTLIDIPAGGLVKTINLGKYRRPHGMEWLDNRRAVVTVEDNQAIIVVDVSIGKVESAIETGRRVSHMLAVSPDGSRAFVTSIGSGTLTAIDLVAGVKLADVKTGDGAEGIAITPDGREVWVTNRGEDTVSVVHAHKLTILATLASPSFPIRAKITPDGRHALVSNARSGDVAVFDVATKKLARKITFDGSLLSTDGRLFGGSFGKSSVPIGILIRPDGRRAWVAHAHGDVVSVIDLATWKVTGALKAGREPDGLAWSPLSVGDRVAPAGS